MACSTGRPDALRRYRRNGEEPVLFEVLVREG
jgi:hypothetical protein